METRQAYSDEELNLLSNEEREGLLDEDLVDEEEEETDPIRILFELLLWAR